ncbi:MAG: MerR family transcriptional regulator [Planctomycetes bacterium]|nr:MerR family transcriptional regulator [Planctomycetota bacterium]
MQIPPKRYRIGEIVRCSPFSRQTIHNYTIMGLIREAEWTEGGHRLYDETVFERLSRIEDLRRTKSLAEIRRILTAEEHTEPQAAHPEAGPRDRQDRYRSGGGDRPQADDTQGDGVTPRTT